MSASALIRSSTIPSIASLAARIKGVVPSCVLAFKLVALFLRRIWKTPIASAATAECSGVRPVLSCAFASAPASRRRLDASALAYLGKENHFEFLSVWIFRRVESLIPINLGPAIHLSIQLTHLAARCNDVSPVLSMIALRSAPWATRSAMTAAVPSSSSSSPVSRPPPFNCSFH
ncbi:unnamed protein product [Nesidiocoris tenuis]|uniref:Uncharacterized protein n=1 Tax=Nesidiocoris tenuis TaxID=355587 RepID=A0A6H5H6R8_9HEMI|nr:unnamed protein product [Nesidiocoris tenuis]